MHETWETQAFLIQLNSTWPTTLLKLPGALPGALRGHLYLVLKITACMDVQA